MGVGGLRLDSTWHFWLLAWPHDTIPVSPRLPPVCMGDSTLPLRANVRALLSFSVHLLTCVVLYCVLFVIIIISAYMFFRSI